jgi:inhibitor of the pro-sigma K processing machinery
MDLTTAFWYAAGIILALVLVQLLAKPIELAVRVLANSVVGGLALWVVNQVGGAFHFHIGLNPISAVVVGVLGAPGLVSLGIIRAILG